MVAVDEVSGVLPELLPDDELTVNDAVVFANTDEMAVGSQLTEVHKITVFLQVETAGSAKAKVQVAGLANGSCVIRA